MEWKYIIPLNMVCTLSWKIMAWMDRALVWFGLVYLFIHSVTQVTSDMSITDYNLYITTQLTIYGHPPCMIQSEHKIIPWLQTFITRKLCGTEIFFYHYLN
jgi:hypothetical protein